MVQSRRSSRSDNLVHRRPRGIAVVLVLGLLAITLAVSYATLRGQGATTELARNQTRALDAQAAAHSGLAAALRAMAEDGWSGVNVDLLGSLTPHSGYEVTYSTGDVRLPTTSSEYPFRVTITSTGYATDSSNPALRAVHKGRCVVQLVRRALTPEPANWNTLTGNTLLQWGNSNTMVTVPLRVDGPATIWGKVVIPNSSLVSTEYPWSSTSRDRYLSDLNAMRQNGRPDYRPLPSPLNIARARQTDSTQLGLLENKLGLTLVDSTPASGSPLPHPGAVLTYRLYPGGQEYEVPVVQEQYSSTLQNLTLGPDPLTNPLGIFRSNGPLSIQSNVQITGTLITAGTSPEIQVYGNNVQLTPANLPELDNSSQTFQLPALLIASNLRVNSLANVQIHGFTMVWNEMELRQGSQNTRLTLEGNLATNIFTVRGRDTWVMTSSDWLLQFTNFINNLSLALTDPNRIAYFPEYLEAKKGMKVQPALTLRPKSSAVQPHWHDWTQPIYQKGPGDLGLLWEVVRWENKL